MKKSLSSLLLGLLVTVTLFSCNKDDEEISVEAGIVGTWAVESTDVTLDGKSLEAYVEEAIAQLKDQMGENYSDEMGTQFEEMFTSFDMSEEMEGIIITFAEDKTVTVTDNNIVENGTWSVSGNTLTVTIDDPQTFEVRSITSSRAALYSSFDETEFDQSSSIKIESIINLKK